MNQSIDNRTDEEIIQAVIHGDKEMYGQLMERYQNLVKGYAFHLCRNREVAMDLAQDTFITGYQHLGRLKEPKAFPGWLLGILKNKWRNLGRENKIPTISLGELGYDPPDSGQRSSYSEEQLEKISNYVYSLPENYREVILLRYLHDSSYKEIAQVLGIPVSTVTKRLFHAREFLLKKAQGDGLL